MCDDREQFLKSTKKLEVYYLGVVALAANVKSSRQVEKNHDAFVKRLKRY